MNHAPITPISPIIPIPPIIPISPIIPINSHPSHADKQQQLSHPER